MRSCVLCRVLAAIGLLGALASAEAATVLVTNLNDSGAGSLRQVIASANAGDTIQIDVIGTINLNSGLTVDKALNIYGIGARYSIITRASGAPNFRILTVTGGPVDLRYVTISNGKCANNEFGGGGINVASGVRFDFSYAALSGNDANGNSGGGIFNNGGTVFLFASTITDNQALLGGAVFANGGFVEASNCTIANNEASTTATNTGGGGGIFNFNGSVTVYCSTITGNSATTNSSSGGGGGIRNFSGTLQIGDTIVANNTSNQLGPDVLGAFTSVGYNLIRVVDDSTGFGFTGDQLGTSAAPRNPDLGPLRDNGGPVDTKAPNSGSSAIDQGIAFPANDARGRPRPYDNPNIPNAPGGDGSDIGAVEIQAPTVVTNNNDSGPGSLREAVTKPKVQSGDTITFAPNVTGTINLTSGELFPQESITVNGPGQTVLTVARSAAAGTDAFRIFNIAQNVTVTISGLAMSNGAPSQQQFQAGGAIYNAGTLTVRDCTIQDNVGYSGGGIANLGTLTVNRCAFYRNNGSASQYGGGIANLTFNNVTAVTTVTASTFAENTAVRGGGLYNAGTLSMTNCTVSGNTANPSGGGIYNNSGTTTLLNCTVANNSVSTTDTSGGGGGIYSAATTHLGNTIVASNTHNQAGRDVFGAFISDGYNLIRVKEDSTGFTDGVNHDLVGTAASPRNAFLGQLQLNGGTTATMSLGASSPAINAGNDATAPNRDQRGFVRVGTSDIGAYEFNGSQPVTLANISTRAFIQTGDNVLIGGFIVTGTQAKRVIVRAIGPSLPFTGVLADPVLELHGPGAFATITNDNWRSDQEAEIIATTIPPSNDLESAIVATLAPNNSGYTVIVRGANNGTGIGVVEAYDLDRTVDSKLANISTRGLVQTGDNVLIGGLIVLGQDPQRVLVRAIGPSLPVAGKLEDPVLELRDGNGTLIRSNDNWRSDQEAEIMATTIPPSNDLESALIETLPGNGAAYTATVRGVNNGTGVGLVEVYALN